MGMVGYGFLKRAFDIIISLLVITIFWPVFILIAFSIVLTSGGGVIFKHQRIGKEGRPFMLYKFRTMASDTPAYIPKPQEDDPRISSVGRFLRGSFLDELPQVFNVLKGEMSIVGPRPEMPFIVERYSDEERLRLGVKPGLTGLWQLSGKTNEPIHHNLEFDLNYIKHRSLFMDFKIVIITVIVFFKLSYILIKKNCSH